MSNPETAPALAAENLATLASVSHGFFTRGGGVSRKIYESLNCGFGSGDDRDNVAENRRRVMSTLGFGVDRLNTVFQVHGTEVLSIESPLTRHNTAEAARKAPKADALVTRVPGVALGILTADCAPVLLADPVAGVIGAAHAGWRGLLDGVLEAAIAAMAGLGASAVNIHAAIGPCIGAASYEVDDDLANRFTDQSIDQGHYLGPATRPGHQMFNLGACARHRLQLAGVGNIQRIDCDTYADQGRFFSYRRSSHRNEADYGRMLSAIAFKD